MQRLCCAEEMCDKVMMERGVLQIHIIFILDIIFMQGIYNDIPKTNHVARAYSVAATVYLIFVQ
jgi:hypothetical protein